MSDAKEVIAAEVAEVEFQRWMDAMGLASKLDPEGFDLDDRKAFDRTKRTILEAIRFGRLVVDDEGQFRFTPAVGDDKSPIVFYEPDGAALLAMDKAGKSGDVMHKQYAVLAAATKQFVQRFSKMKARDLAVCDGILGFLLAK